MGEPEVLAIGLLVLVVAYGVYYFKTKKRVVNGPGVSGGGNGGGAQEKRLVNKE